MIIAHLTYDMHSLHTCTMTCHSWYIVAVPHLHHTLVAPTCSLHKGKESAWPESLLYRHKLGLLPLVRLFWVREDGPNCVKFSPKLFNHKILCQFSSLINVQELRIDNLDLPSFMPSIRQYFGHFLPTVHCLFLREPHGSRRQILYFIGMFQHLEDLGLLYDRGRFQNGPENDPTLIPPFAPPLRGGLTVTCLTGVDLLKDMIDLFGGIRFRCMNLLGVGGIRLLLDACARTLETVMLYPTDGERLPLRGI